MVTSIAWGRSSVSMGMLSSTAASHEAREVAKPTMFFSSSTLQESADVADGEDSGRTGAQPNGHAGLDVADRVFGRSLFQGGMRVR